MKITCISDLHGHYPQLPGGDLLIVAGDLTARDEPGERIQFLRWLSEQNYRKRIFIGGNHDNSLVGTNIKTIEGGNTHYLCDSGTEFEWFETEDTKWGPRHLPGLRGMKLKIWGSPWTKRFPGVNPHCTAFMLDSDEELAEKWVLIPEDTDILITHCPPYGIMDTVLRDHLDTDGERHEWRDHTGSGSLTAKIQQIRPKLHVFGHIHERYGQDATQWGLDGPITRFVNASHVNERYEPVNPPIEIEL